MKWTRRQFLKAAVGACAVAGQWPESTLAGASSQAHSRPNIVLLLADDQGSVEQSLSGADS